jgi:SPP1 gp7 family putative phage head morphogenesis protein
LNLQKAKKDAYEAAVKKVDDAISKITDVAAGMIEKIIVAKNKKVKSQKNGETFTIKSGRDEKVTKHVQSYLKAADNHEKTFTNTIKGQFERERQQILDKLPEKDINLDDFLLNPDDESQLIVEVTSPLIKNIIKDQGELASALVGTSDFDILTERVQNYIKKRAFKFSFEMTEETNLLLQETLKEGIKLGESIPQFRKRIDELFEAMEKYRSERIARSEVIRASNFAAKEAYQQSGVVEELEWLTTDDEMTCEWCGPLNGETIKINDNFFNRGDKYRGDDGNLMTIDYESVNYPPLHPNCRCTIIPVVK